MAALDAAQSEVAAASVATARRELAAREARWEGDLCAKIQTSRPMVDKGLLGRRLDVCCSYEPAEGGSELRWCPGKVVLVSDGRTITRGPRSRLGAKEAVLISWDADEARNEESTTSAQRLLPSLWNPKGTHRAGAWRFDIDVGKYRYKFWWPPRFSQSEVLRWT